MNNESLDDPSIPIYTANAINIEINMPKDMVIGQWDETFSIIFDPEVASRPS